MEQGEDTKIKREIRKTLQNHKLYSSLWEEIKINEHRNNLQNMLDWMSAPIFWGSLYPNWVYDFRRKFFGFFGYTVLADRLVDERDEVDELIEINGEIKDKIYNITNLFILNPEDKTLLSQIEEINGIIDTNLDASTKLMYAKNKEEIKDLIKSGKRRLAHMKDITIKLQNSCDIESYMSLEFRKKHGWLRLAFTEIYDLKNEAELLVKDETLPATLKYLGVMFTGIIALVALYSILT